jgi:hypothetical protein
MKQKLKLFLLFICTLNVLQIKAQGTGMFYQPLTPKAIFDTVYDKEGKKYLLKDLEIYKYYDGSNASRSISTTCNNAGYFNLFFQTGSLGNGTLAQQNANRDAICQAFKDISSFITSPLTGSTTVNILIAYDPIMDSSTLGYATQFYTMPTGLASSTIGGIVDGEVYKTIVSGHDSYTNVGPILYNVGTNVTAPNGGYFHGMAAFNFYTLSGVTWNTALNNLSLSPTEYDLYTVALHEATHALGFASLIGSNGLSKLAGSGFNYFSRYDKFLKDKNNVFLLKQIGSTCGGNYDYTFNSPATSTVVLTAGTCSNSTIFTGTANQKCYTPSIFSNGSSLSHFDDACHTPTFSAGTGNVMHPFSINGQTKRYYQPEERKALCDLGYNVGTTFGSTVALNTTTYTGGACSGIGIAGTNDGFNAGGYIWTAPSGSVVTIPISTILANDFNASQLTCAELIYGIGTITLSATTLSFTPNSTYAGPFVIRYTPYNGTNYGNITYIFGYITPGTCNPVNICNIVQNGGFESISGTYQCGDAYHGTNIGLNCWDKLTYSPDLFGTGCTNNASSSTSTNNTAYNLGTNTFSSNPIFTAPPTNTLSSFPPNNHVLGLIGGTEDNVAYSESMMNFLSTPLVNGQTYNISFWIYNYQGLLKYPYSGAVVSYTVNQNATNNVFGFATSSLTAIPTTTANSWSPNSAALTPIFSYTSTNINTWTFVSGSFVFNGTANGNILQMGSNVGANINAGYTLQSTGQSYWHYVLIDEVSILPANIAPTLSIPQYTNCSSITTITNIAQYATPSSPTGTITGNGITFSGGQYDFNPITAGPGIHTITYAYADGLGCVQNTSQQLFVPSTAVSSNSNIICSGSATLTASGAVSYTWNPGAIVSPTIVVSPTVATVYTLTSLQSNGSTCSLFNIVNPQVSSLCCSAPNTTIGSSLTSSVNMASGSYTVSGSVIDIKGTVTFTGNTSFTGYTFRMGPQALLRVNTSTTLTLTNCKFFSCSELWNGIELKGDNGLNCGNIVSNNTTFEDMYNGIFVDYWTYAFDNQPSKGSISLTNSKFNKNYVSVQIKNSIGATNGSSAYPFSMVTTSITSATSTTSPGSSLKPSSTYTYAYNTITNGSTSTSAPYLNFPRAFTGIQLTNLGNLSSVVIGSTSSATLTNTFNNLDFGIVGTSCNVNVNNNYFKGINGSKKSTDPVIPPSIPPAQGPDEIGIAVAMTQTASMNTCSVGTGTVLPTGGNPYPRGNKFEDCNKAVSFINNRNATFKGNVVTTNTTTIPTAQGLNILPNTYYFYQGQVGAWIAILGAISDLSFNDIQNIATGIYNSSTMQPSGSVTIQNNRITAPSATGYCMQAIQAEQSGGSNIPTDQLSVSNNTLTNVYRGVVSNGVLSGLLIKANVITVAGTTKTLNYTANSQRTGVALTNCQYASVKGNSLTQNGSVPTTTATALAINGVYLKNSPNGKTECNTATKLGRCFVFEGTCDNSWKVNAMSNSYTGLEIRTLGRIGIQGAPSGSPGNPNLSANTWTTITRHTNILSSAGNNTLSPLYVLTGATTTPTLNFGTSGHTYSISPFLGIRTQTAGTSYTCNAGSAQRLAGGNNTGNSSNMRTASTEDSLANYISLANSNENTYDVFTDEFLYQNKQLVFKLIDADSLNVTDGSALDNFYQANQNTAIDQLTQVQEAIANVDVNAANAANASVDPSNVVEYKHQRTNELVLKYLTDKFYTYTNAEKQDLYNYANECIIKGYYVVQARNIINIITNQIVNYNDDCEAEANAQRKAKANSNGIAKQLSFAILPNPNNGEMTLVYDLGSYAKASFELLDVTGKVINKRIINNTVGTLAINEQNLLNGIYFYRILDGESILKTDKIVIIK